jgi:hypothetical protein
VRHPGRLHEPGANDAEFDLDLPDRPARLADDPAFDLFVPRIEGIRCPAHYRRPLCGQQRRPFRLRRLGGDIGSLYVGGVR